MEDLTLKQLSYLVMKQAEEKGFGTTPEDINVGEKIALIHTEISEAYEAYRHNNFEGKDSFQKELGDAVERIFHLAGIMGIDLEKEILEKQEMNKNRVWDWTEMNEKR